MGEEGVGVGVGCEAEEKLRYEEENMVKISTSKTRRTEPEVRKKECGVMGMQSIIISW